MVLRVLGRAPHALKPELSIAHGDSQAIERLYSLMLPKERHIIITRSNLTRSHLIRSPPIR